MIAAGAACGIAVSFGAPIGGALFAYEISKPNTFWTFSGLWKVFAATSIAVFTLSILWSLADGAPLSISDSAALKLGNVTQNGQNTILDLPAAIFLGIIAGLMGAAFIATTIKTAVLRKRFVNNNWKKVVECFIFCFVTVTVFYVVVCARRENCYPIDEKADFTTVQFTCGPNEYNPLATLLFSSEGGTVSQMFRYPQLMAVQISEGKDASSLVTDIFIYFILWCFFFTLTFGLFIPAGVFVPGMLIGCSLGMLYLDVFLDGFNMSPLRLGG